MKITPELKELIEMRVSYYRHHGVEAMATSGDERLLGFVVADFTELLAKLEEAIENENQ